MPELPEVQTVVTTLLPKVLRRTIQSVRLLRADIVQPQEIDLPALLIDRVIHRLSRRGKRIVFELSDRQRFYIHLGMTGQLTLQRPTDPIKPHTHLILELAGQQIRFRDPRRFGGVFWLGTLSAGRHMGPEPLTLRPERLVRQLTGTSRAIKTALLDQSIIAGIGNIYADEALFQAGIHPQTRACDLEQEQILRLNRAIKLVLRRAIRGKGSSLRDYVDANGIAGSAQLQHRVYDRADQPCRNCRATIARIVLGGRSTHFCPVCQQI